MDAAAIGPLWPLPQCRYHPRPHQRRLAAARRADNRQKVVAYLWRVGKQAVDQLLGQLFAAKKEGRIGHVVIQQPFVGAVGQRAQRLSRPGQVRTVAGARFHQQFQLAMLLAVNDEFTHLVRARFPRQVIIGNTQIKTKRA